MYEKEDPEQYAELKKVWNNYQSNIFFHTLKCLPKISPRKAVKHAFDLLQ